MVICLQSARVLLLGVLCAAALAGCVKQGQLPTEDPQVPEQDVLAATVLHVLDGEGYVIAGQTPDGRAVQTHWLVVGEQAHRVDIKISQTSMGLALSTRVDRATPVAGGVEPATTVEINGATWFVAPARATDEEARIGRLIEAAWRQRRHAKPNAR